MSSDVDGFDPFALIGALFLAILSKSRARRGRMLSNPMTVNGYLFGVLSQQFYSYWIGGFKDSKRIRAFVISQFSIIIFQNIMLWQLGWNVFVVSYCASASSYKDYTWQYPVSSVSQCVLILSANVFLAIRIYTLTKSRLKSGFVIAFSIFAFISGVVNVVTTWVLALNSTFIISEFTADQRTTAVLWHGSQAIAECLITIFLSRALLMSRSGLEKSDGIVNYVVRRVIQIGLLATLWAIIGLATWFLLPKSAIYLVFDLTAGSVYMHVIYDTLLSRIQLRERLAEGNLGLRSGLPTQSHTLALEGKRTSEVLYGGVTVVPPQSPFSEAHEAPPIPPG
ncbi:hypothetical protein BJV74DRAFT_81984 [Russula compacta]|nr:hypothetical protein BJV74DRAFT_81984 [Russula compacta]